MSSFDDYDSEMHRPLDDKTCEQLLVRRAPAEADLALVAAFLEDVRAEAARPAPQPSPALAAVLAAGLPTEALGVPAAPAVAPFPVHQASPEGVPTRRRRVAPGWVAKLAGATVLAKAGLGLSVAAASVTGAAVAGVPVARDVVEAVTPVEFPDGGPNEEHRKGDRAPANGAERGSAGDATDNRGKQGDLDEPQRVQGVAPTTHAPPRVVVPTTAPHPTSTDQMSKTTSPPPATAGTTPAGAVTGERNTPDSAGPQPPVRGEGPTPTTTPSPADGERRDEPVGTTAGRAEEQRLPATLVPPQAPSRS